MTLNEIRRLKEKEGRLNKRREKETDVKKRLAIAREQAEIISRFQQESLPDPC